MKVVTPSGSVVTPADATRKRWLAARKTGIGASDSAAILGLSPWTTAVEVWLDKQTEVDDLAIEAAEWGLAHESTIARKVNTRHRKEIGHVHPSPGLMRSDEHAWMLATPDRLLYLDRGQDWDRSISEDVLATGLLEIKTSSERLRDRWKNGPPLYYQVQVQQQLAVTGLREAYLAVLHGGNHMPTPYRILRDDLAIEQIVDYVGSWWTKHIVNGVEPEPRWPADVDNINALWTADPGTVLTVADDDDLPLVVEAYRQAKADEARAKALAAQYGFRIKDRLRDATEARAGDRTLLTWRAHTAREIDVTRLRAERPDLATEFTRERTVRSLRLKKEPTTDE